MRTITLEQFAESMLLASSIKPADFIYYLALNFDAAKVLSDFINTLISVDDYKQTRSADFIDKSLIIQTYTGYDVIISINHERQKLSIACLYEAETLCFAEGSYDSNNFEATVNRILTNFNEKYRSIDKDASH